MEKSEFRVLIKHCFLMGKNTVKTREWLQKCYGESAPSKSMIEKWFSDFRCGRTSTSDAERSGRPKEATTPEMIEKIHDIVIADRKVRLIDIVNIVNISKERVGYILHEHLHMRKLAARWVPRMLTIDQKRERVTTSKQVLEMIQRNKAEFKRRYITIDETWIHHYTPESRQQSAQWMEPGESRAKRPKTQESAGKVLATVFWDAHGIIFIDYLEKGKTINADYYVSLLDRLKDEIKRKRPHLARKKVLFHHDNAPPHTAVKTMAKINELGWDLVPHPPYSPDLAPSDYYLFPNLKRWLKGKRFRSNEEVEWETDAYFGSFDKNHYSKGIDMLEDRLTKCIELKGEYVEE